MITLRALEDLYCKVFVDAPLDAQELARLISLRVGEALPWNTVRTDNLELEVRNNDDFLPAQKRKHRDDFVYYRLYLDIDPVSGTARDKYVNEVADLLQWLWGQAFPAVAACDFEDELPKHELGSFYRHHNNEEL